MDRKSYYESLLSNRRQQLLQRQGRAALTRRASPTCASFAEGAGRRMDRLAQQLFLERMEREDALELEQIAAAQRRLESGQYGRCVSCGGTVAEGRLQLLPHTAVCSRCADKHSSDLAEPDCPAH